MPRKIGGEFQPKRNNFLLASCIFLAAVFLAYLALALPTVTFVPPTLSNSQTTANNWLFVNFTIDEPQNQTIIGFNGTNYTIYEPSLVLNLPFNEGSGTTAYDNSMYGNNGTLYNGTQVCGGNSTFNSSCPQWTSGRFGGGLQFDGVNDYVDAGNNNILNVGISDFTIELWTRTIPDATYRDLLTKGGGGGSVGWGLRTKSSSQSYFEIYNGTPPRTLITFMYPTDNLFHYIAVVANRSANATIYLDSIIASSRDITNYSTSINSASSLRIGGWNSYFNGTIDEVRIYNRSLSAAEIAQHYNMTFGKYYANFTNLTDGIYNYTVYAQNTTGSWNASETRNVTIHATPLTITVQSPINKSYSTSSIWFNTTFNDIASWAAYSLDGGANITMSNSSGNWNAQNASMAEGSHNVVFYANGTSGIVTSSGLIYFTIDITPPIVMMTSPSNNTNYFNNSIPLTFSIVEANRDKCWYSLDGINTTFDCSNQSVLSKEYDNTTGVVGWWHFNEGSGSYANDSSGYGNTGTVNGPAWVTGKLKSALQFNGINNYVDAGNGAILNMTNSTNFTVEAWVKKIGNVTSGNTMGIAMKGISGSIVYGIDYYFSGNQIRAGIRNAINGAQVATYTPPDYLLNWNHIVFTYTTNSTNGIKLYVNGILQSSLSTVGFSDFSSSVNLKIGADSILAGSPAYFNGTIDEVRILNRSLSAAEIFRDYAMGTGTHNLTVYANDTAGNVGYSSSIFNILAESYSYTYLWNSRFLANITVSVQNPSTSITVGVYNSTQKLGTKTILPINGTGNVSFLVPSLDTYNLTGAIPFIIESCANNICNNNTLSVYIQTNNFTYWWNEANRMNGVIRESYYKSDTLSTLQWAEAYLQAGYIKLYETTLDTAYIDTLVAHFDYMLGNRRDFNGDGHNIWATSRYSVSRIGDETFENDTLVFNKWNRVNATNQTIYLDSAIKQCGTYSLKLTTNTTTNQSQWISRQIENYTANATYNWMGYIMANNTDAWIKVVDETTGETIFNKTFTSSSSFTYYGESINYSFRAPSNSSHNLTLWFSPLNVSVDNAAIWLDGCAHPNDFVVNKWLADPTSYGQVLKPITLFIRAVKNRNLTEYQAKADEYLNIIQSNFVPINNRLGTAELKEWKCGANNCAVFVFADGELDTVNNTIALNGMYQYMRVILDLYNITGNTTYLAWTNETAFWLKNYALTYDPANDQYLWAYRTCTDQQWDVNSGCTSYTSEDNSHGQLELEFMIDAYNDGIIFNLTDMQRLANTFRKTTWNGAYDNPDINDKIQGNGAWGTYKWETRGWLQLASFDYNLFYPIERMYGNGGYIDHGSYLESISKIMNAINIEPIKLKLGANQIYGRGYANSTNTTEVNITAIPTNSMINVTVNEFNTVKSAGQILINLTASSQLSNNPVNFTVCALNPNQNYTIQRDSASFATATADPSGCISFSNSAWSTREFTIAQTAATAATTTSIPVGGITRTKSVTATTDDILTKITVNLNTRVYNPSITVAKLASIPAAIPAIPSTEPVYQYFNITKSGFDNQQILNASIDFKINRSWIVDNNITNVSLARYENGWSKLRTELVNSTAIYNSYRAYTNSLSYFAIIGEQAAQPFTQQPKNETEANNQPELPFSFNPYFPLLIAILPAILIYIFRNRIMQIARTGDRKMLKAQKERFRRMEGKLSRKERNEIEDYLNQNCAYLAKTEMNDAEKKRKE